MTSALALSHMHSMHSKPTIITLELLSVRQHDSRVSTMLPTRALSSLKAMEPLLRPPWSRGSRSILVFVSPCLMEDRIESTSPPKLDITKKKSFL